MAARKLRAGAAGTVALLLATCLVFAATVASARPLKLSSEGQQTVESPAGDIQTVVTAAHDGAGDRGGHRFMSIDMLAEIKDSGPSPGAGH